MKKIKNTKYTIRISSKNFGFENNIKSIPLYATFLRTKTRTKNVLYRSKGKNVVLLEIGVGFNTPGIIRFPFEQMTTDSEKTTLIRIRM